MKKYIVLFSILAINYSPLSDARISFHGGEEAKIRLANETAEAKADTEEVEAQRVKDLEEKVDKELSSSKKK